MAITCPHDSAIGVDQDFSPDKVWECLECGGLYRVQKDDAGFSVLVDLDDEEVARWPNRVFTGKV